MPVLPTPPSSLTGPVGEYLLVLWRTLNGIPNISAFSGNTPNSSVTGLPGDLAVNITSSNTDIRLWQLSGSARVPSTTGWNPV